jgi:subtilisin family serine protease
VLRAFVAAVALALLVATPAAADQVETTAQAKAARAGFLLQATPPGPAAAICLVDTGVNVNPDTAGVSARLAMAGDPADQSPTLHGTTMAMFIGGASNGFGMVGLWPAARILSIRANEPGQDAFSAVPFIKAVQRCSDSAQRFGVQVVALPYASELALTPFERQFLADEVKGARDEQGLSFVAAAGDNGGQPMGTVAGIPGVLSVGATDSISGDRCGFSATGSLLLAPGCSLDGADPATGAALRTQQSTSLAAVIAATAVAALRTWRPDLTPAQADQLLIEHARQGPPGRSLDLTAAFTAAGLGHVAPPLPADPPPPAPPAPAPAPQAKQRLPKPQITTRSRGHGAKRVLTVKASNRPRGARLAVRVYVRGRGGKLRRVASRTRTSATVTIRIRSWRRVTATFSDPTGTRLQSPARIVTRG